MIEHDIYQANMGCTADIPCDWHTVVIRRLTFGRLTFLKHHFDMTVTIPLLAVIKYSANKVEVILVPVCKAYTAFLVIIAAFGDSEFSKQ